MTKVTFSRPFNLLDIDMADFLGGSVNIATLSSTNADITDGNYAAKVTGTGFNFSFAGPTSGTVHEVHTTFKGGALFDATDMSVSLVELYAERENGDALVNLFFGGADVFKGSKGADVIGGFGGADKINGAKGIDHLAGGAGADILTGGADADTFVYTAISDSTKKVADLITDLDAQDSIDLTALNVQGDITSAYSEKKDITAFSIDVDGDHRVDMVITASGDHTGYDHFVI